MRRYKRILAIVLAASLTVGGFATPDSIKASSVAGIENTTDESTDDDSMHIDTDQQEKVSDHNAVDNEEKTDEIDKENDGKKDDTKENNTKDTVNTENTDTEDKKNNADKINTTESINTTEGINTTESINATEGIGDINSTEYDAEQDDGIMLLDAGVSLELLAADSEKSGVTWTADSNTITVTLKGFVLLSNCSADSLQNKNIIVESTGSSNITEEVEYNGQKYKYAGIGTADCPFEGTLSAGQITTDTTLFGGISSEAKVNINLIWTGDGSKPFYAQQYEFAKADSYSLFNNTDSTTSVTVSVADGKTIGSLIGTVSGQAGTLKIGSGVTYPAKKEQIAVNSSENAGLICNTLKAGTIQLDGFSFPSAGYSVTADTGNAGGMIGAMKAGTALKAGADTQISQLSVTANNGNAGGIVGEIEKGASLIAESGKEFVVSEPSVTASAGCAGGIAGKAEEAGTTILSQTESNDKTDSKPFQIKSPTVNGKNAGGLFGDYIIENQAMSYPTSVNLVTPTILPNGNGGGLFGVLELNSKSSYTKSTYTIEGFEFACTKSGNENNSAYGSIVGQVISDSGVENALFINNCKVQSTFNNDNTQYHGGLIGKVGENNNAAVYVEVNGTSSDGIQITVSNPAAQNRFGGIIGCLSEGSVLKMTGTVKITTGNNISKGGGIVGEAKAGSAVEFNGTTDLSEVKYAWDKTSEGQLIGRQESSLIYARGDGNGNGWKFIRTNAANNTNKELNDIGNYGEVIRLQADSNPMAGLDKELIKINAEHQIELKQAADYTGNSNYSGDITLASKEGLALLAITWQTRGYFSADKTYIPTNSWTELTKKKISLSADIDLTGTGILGIERDIEEKYNPYKGNFEGNKHTIKLAIGEIYGQRKSQSGSLENVSDKEWGNGQIYSAGTAHNTLGLFSTASGSVRNLTIDGFIHASTENGWADIGGYAAELRGNNISVTVENVTASESMNLRAADNTKVGGIYGECIGAVNITLKNFISKAEFDFVKSKNQDWVGGFCGVYSGNNSETTIDCQSVQLSTKITTVGSKISSGGVIGVISNADKKRTITINSIQVNEYRLNQDKNTDNNLTTCGGVLGYLWENTDVVFNTPADANAYALSVADSIINAPNAPVGGLVYQGSGKWQINDKGIDIKSATFNANTLGLLLCHAEEKNGRALYLEMTANWDTAYKLENVTVGGSPAVYDEMIAYTTDNADHILDNNKNAIISLATGSHMGVDTAECNTYINRTNYGKTTKPTNPNSRYYYNLDQIVASQNGQSVSGWLDTPEKLMIWDVYTYADESLKGYFPVDAGNIKGIGTDAASKAAIDLTGYSYYPVDVGAMTIQNAEIRFANETIEEKEKANKSTQGNNTGHTQHYAMHGGLFRNMISSEDVTTTVENVTFQGTIGKVNGASGVLSFGNIEGNAAVTPQRFHTLKFSKVEFSAFRVTDAGTDYAPILINQTGSYTTLVFNDVKADGYGDSPQKPAGSSLLGNIGGSDKTQISLTFNKMKFPDKPYGNGGIFTHATFLESFQYKSGGIGTAIYNFYKAEDWKGTVHRHDVTYGSEISDSVEYTDLQHWYYDEQTYGQSEGYVRYEKPDDTGTEYPDFKAYLPYVCDKQSKASHEIKVNQRIADLLEGCGTYGHPYKITTALEMKTIADYIATATPQTGWKVQVTGDQSDYHTAPAGTDSVYEYDGATWYQVQKQSDTDDTGNAVESWQKTGKTVSNDMVHCYILSAYYDILAKENTDTAQNKVLELENFAGLGTELYPFRGVVVSNNGSTVKIGGDNIANGFIVYSYGSVVKDITIQYSGKGKTLTYQKPDDDDYQPKSFFGGVIGCIMGGDNIIDNVKVSMDTDWTLTLDGNNNYLIQAGGYVGSVSGGGVIFRNINAKSDTAFTGLTASHLENGTSLYVNPYVGRVLDGYAFSEDCVIDNGTQNYKINQLTDTAGNDITTKVDTNNDYTVTIQNAQGLLLMSAIINSGAAGAGGTYAYYGTPQSYSNYEFGNGIYGKIRNASYEYVGKTNNKAAEDFAKSINDDTNVPSKDNAPYLITKYSNGETFLVAGYSNGKRNQVDFQLNSKSTYDMRDYGNGYQGISARYLSNAVNAGSNVLGTVYAKPFVKGFNGNKSTIKVEMQMKEYADDDFHGISFGGVFNLIWAAKATELTDKVLAQNLTIDNSRISLSYCNKDGNATSGDSNMRTEQGKYCVGVGGFAGNSAQNSFGNEENASYVFQHIEISNSDFTGPISAGGLMGSAGLGSSDVNSGVGQLLNVSKNGGNNNRNNFGVNLVNCQYDHLSVTAKYAAGGMVGGLFCNQIEISFGTNDNVRSSVSVTEEAYKTVGQKSSIVINNTNTTIDKCAGGIFGAVATALYVNDENLSISDVYQNTGKTLYTACLQDITIRNLKPSGTKEIKRYAGGVVGSIQENNCYVYHIEMKKSDALDNVISGTTAAGGMIGYAKISGKKIELQNCRAENIKLQDAEGGIGGMIGIVEGKGSGSAEMKITGCISQGIHAAGSEVGVSTGGMVGLLRNNQPLTLQSCIVLDSTIGSENNKSAYYGGFAGTITPTSDARLSIFDSELTNTKINGKYAGGIISAAHGRIYGSNILLNQVSVAAGGKAGLIVGAKQSDSYNGLYMAGVSVKGNSTANNVKTQLTGDAKILEKGYIALADYEGTSMTAGNQNPTAGTAGLLGAEGVAPYVVTSPKNSMSVVDTDGTEKYLFGDSTSWSADGNTFKLEAQKILEEAGTQQDGKFVYNATGVTLKSSKNPDGFDFSTVFSTYNQNQMEKAAKDFPVLMITGNESDKIKNYLDIVTNGGYSQAKKLNGTNGTHVTAEVKVYNYNASTGKFIASNDTPALQINNNGKNQMSFQADATDYDNQKNRFTLLTVTFAENGHEYHVQVPIIVRRVLEIDFTATLSYGTHFRADDYANLTGHILDSFGNAMTGYLTYAYNSSLGEVSAFGWQNYVDAGGDVTQAFAKSIEFYLQRGKIPAGTQLTLVDCQDKNKKAYFYTVTEEEEKQNRKEFLYSNFKATDGVTAYKNLSIGEALEAKAEKSGSGKFIAVNADGKPLDVNGNIVDNIGTPASGISPTVKIDDRYYRLPQDGEDVSKLDKYTVTMDDHIHNENYYLVITFPETAGKEPINGYITTNVKGNIPMHLTDTLRQKKNGKGQTDSHSNTASTFQISSGYTQSLEDQDQRNPARKEIKLGDSALTVDILDTITFSNEQYYNDTDNLFLKFTGNLSIVTSENGTEKVDTSQFPAGTKGKVRFYVYSKSGDHATYYKYDSSTNKWKQTSVKDEAVEYPWISEGYHMELLLSEDGTIEKAVNLQQIRSIVKGNNRSGNSTFYVEAVLEAELPAAGLDVIPAASLVKDAPEEYAKLGYLSQISTEKESLAYSSNRALLTYDQTNVKYYRNSSVKSTLTYDADDVNQLGINPYDLGQNLDRDKKNVIISTTAEYDLSMIPKMETLLRDSKEVRFSLTVSQKDEKDGNTENYKTPLTRDAKDYMDIKLVSPGASEVQFEETTGIWSWSIPKEVYWDEQNSKLKTTDGVFDGDVFIQNLNLLVRLDNVEEKQHFYSNYKVELRAEIVDKNSNVSDQPNPESDYLIYTLAKIRPEFVE